MTRRRAEWSRRSWSSERAPAIWVGFRNVYHGSQDVNGVRVKELSWEARLHSFCTPLDKTSALKGPEVCKEDHNWYLLTRPNRY